MKSFNKDEILVCVINAKVTLTLFEEYKVLDEKSGQVLIKNDDGEDMFYTEYRFIRKSDMREFTINKILKN